MQVKQTKRFEGAYVHGQTIEMGFREDKGSRAYQAVWRHEFGHFVDRELGTQRALGTYLSSSKEFKSAVQADARAIKADAMHNLSRVVDREKYDSLTAFYEKSRSDFIDLESNGAREAWLASRYKAAGLNYEEFKAAMKKNAVFPELLEGIGLLNRYREIIDGFDKKDFQKLMDAMVGGIKNNEGVIRN